MALPFLSLFGVFLLFGDLALLLSMLLPARRYASMIADLVLVASYFMSSLARLDEDLQFVARFSPLDYYQGGQAIGGLDLGQVAGLLGLGLLFAILGVWRSNRRDIRVAGEGSWRLL